MPTLTIHHHPDLARYVPARAGLQAVAELLPADVVVHLHRRADLGAVWAATHDGRQVPVPDGSFRAWANGDTIRLLVDDSETPESVAWLLLHELAHVAVTHSPLLRQAYRHRPKPDDYLVDDDVHEAWPEERLANRVATELMPLLGYPRALRARRWWRSAPSSAALAAMPRSRGRRAARR